MEDPGRFSTATEKLWITSRKSLICGGIARLLIERLRPPFRRAVRERRAPS
jgi:hypothetical protein